ncbi:signal transduction histidine kinase [Litorimonas taeanensis]|uniref:histidine kinase n=1 Tax=Litorimonas taeanensis TaxID=568099 RepID=A0A420WDL8_9PROT|nr:ATP-binding protein [Litorimonas taeanensis]RKQ69119.1 signal transduction histidine kinase [Litorimonas taeanensis]
MTPKRLYPRTLAGQLIALLFGVLIIAQLINLVLLVGTQRFQARANAFNTAMEHTARLIAELPEDRPIELPYVLPRERGSVRGVFFVSRDNQVSTNDGGIDQPRYEPRFRTLLEERDITPLRTSIVFFPNRPPRHPMSDYGSAMQHGGTSTTETSPSPNNIRDRRSELQEIRLSVELEPGVWFNAMLPRLPTESLTGRILLATSLLLGLSLLAVWFFARRISRPISSFALAAERLGRGEDPELLSETGPDDMRLAASAFNTMQTRVTRMLETQRTMLRAVGHDLRTPLTSLRLRAENIADDIEREKVISTLADMTVMTEEILSWAKDASGTESLASVDLRSFLESLTDDYQDQGHDVFLHDFESFTVKIRRTSIKRALQNLINNALQFGQSASVSVTCANNMVNIDIADTGPGVTEVQLTEILKPFVRLETSRSKDTGGTGLGLSIANSIAQIHGGTLTLSNQKPNGLRATLSLPI